MNRAVERKRRAGFSRPVKSRGFIENHPVIVNRASSRNIGFEPDHRALALQVGMVEGEERDDDRNDDGEDAQ